MTPCHCPACREPNTVTLTVDGVPLPTASTPPRVLSQDEPEFIEPDTDQSMSFQDMAAAFDGMVGRRPVETLPPGWEEWRDWEGENV